MTPLSSETPKVTAGGLATRAFLAVAAALHAAPAAAAAAADIFDPIGPVLEGQSAHFGGAALVALIAVVPAMILLPIMLLRYRLGGRGRYTPEWEFDTRFEAAIWGVPVIVVCVLAVWLAQATQRLDPYAPLGDDPLRIDLVGLDFRYVAIYPDQRVVALDQIVIPVGRPVSFRLTTDTVMQSFLPNGFAGQIYAMPGMVTQLNLAANRAGEGVATQTQFNGYGFANMRVPMRAVSQADFDAWVGSATGAVLDAAAYPALAAAGDSAQEFQASTPDLRPLGDACLFDRVVARYHQNAAVPVQAQPGSTRYDPAQAALPDADCAALQDGMAAMPHDTTTDPGK